MKKGITTFEGTCFDYAEAACNEITKFKSFYNQIGIDSYAIVCTLNASNIVYTYRILNDQNKASNITINGIPCEITSSNTITSHNNVTNHSWLWLKDNNGIIYWIDPTFTDNNGKPIYGIVYDGEEIILQPDLDLCILK